ncbi:MAG: ATP-binding cassette domain-containing protein [Spirochaetia bacterium]|nr:ATP-binding cassette domain-containing protein [Spirochaetia bacterium]
MQIKLNNLQKTYFNGKEEIPAVNDISLTIPENTIFGIIGKSGAGKSSLVRLISLLETPDNGSVFYNDKRVDNLDKKNLIAQRRKIGMIFQNFNLFSSRTAAKNIAYPLEISGTPKSVIKERVQEMLKLVGLEDRANAPVSTLSGGQKQRIAIARALSTQPDILFCDEATSALDPQTTRSILNLIREIQKKMNLTVVMITHQMEVVRDACESVAVIDSGKVVELGKVSDIFTNPQSEVTKDFIMHISPAENGEPKSEFVSWSGRNGNYVLHFNGETTGKPVLNTLLKKFNLDINFLGGGIQHLPDQNIGTMTVDIQGEQEELSRAISWLKEQNVIVEAVNE